ncbi:sporulation delaying system autorepressor SdpR [Pontibacter rugosus]
MNKVFKALNDATRRDILKLLKEKDMSAYDIAEAFQVTKPTISHHLDLLHQAELVSSEKRGQFVIYSLNTTVLDDLLNWILNLKE